ncbi:MAG: hypothetical protein HWE25_08715 [Alphaproteobacteria bacterium]|nr:hypothetical protein [Alphaproteobacteria bacterium]
MELQLKAQDANDMLIDGHEENDILAAGRSESRLANWRFLNRVRQCWADEALFSTLLIVACGCMLATLLAVSNVADSVADLMRR